jgi:hypothetical protein
MGVKEPIRVKNAVIQIHGNGREGSFFLHAVGGSVWVLLIIKNHKTSFPIRDPWRCDRTFIIYNGKEFVNKQELPVSF